MGQLVDGVWQDTWYDTKSTGGRFKRSVSAFRNWLTADGAAGPSGEGGFAAEKDRYHLYVSLACPWAHRTLIMRKLKGLEPFLPVSVVNPLMLENGWTFDDSFPEATGDTLYQHDFLYQLASLRRSGGCGLYLAGAAGADPRPASLSDGQSANGSRHSPVDHAGTLRPGICDPF